MDKKLYHLGGGEVVIPNKDIQPSSITRFMAAIFNSPIYAYCDPTLPVGWIEGEEVYQEYLPSDTKGISNWWIPCTQIEYEMKDSKYRRIWIEHTRERGITINSGDGFKTQQPDYTKEAEELYPDIDSYGKTLAKRAAHIKAREMSAKEIEELREQVRKLREGLGKLREGLDEADVIFAHLEDFTHGKEGEVITHQRGKIKQLLNETK